jgi:hypothetical protein
MKRAGGEVSLIVYAPENHDWYSTIAVTTETAKGGGRGGQTKPVGVRGCQIRPLGWPQKASNILLLQHSFIGTPLLTPFADSCTQPLAGLRLRPQV